VKTTRNVGIGTASAIAVAVVLTMATAAISLPGWCVALSGLILGVALGGVL